MAAEARADRDALRKSIRDTTSVTDSDAASEDDVLHRDQQPRGDGTQTGSRRGGVTAQPVTTVTQDSLAGASRLLQQLRQDPWSASLAIEALRRMGGPTEDAAAKRLKSGYLMTMNEQVQVQAQWPQLNVYRATSNMARYDSLTVGEFCSGYMRFVIDNLKGEKPNVNIALDYLYYLNELLDEIPLMGWDVVREAHRDILRMVEQCRLNWDDTQDRSRQITKALRRAHVMLGSVKSKDANKKPCPDFQTSVCVEGGSHIENEIMLLHCCATCYKIKKQKYSHTKAECNRQKAIDSKNGSKNLSSGWRETQ